MAKNMTCLVTGGAGFIGSHLVDKLVSKGYKVVVIDNLSTGSRKNLNSKAVFYKLDIQSFKVAKVFKKEKPQALFHFAAQIDVRESVNDPMKDAKINILGSLNLLENCVKYGTKKVIFASTGGTIYGKTDVVPTPENYPSRPISPYGVAKLTIENYLHYYHVVHGIPYIALRFANVYGSRQDPMGESGVIAIFINHLLSGKIPVIYGNGKQTRDYVFIDDVVEAAFKAFQKKAVGKFNIGTGKETSVEKLLKELKDITGSKLKARRAPVRLGEQQRSSLLCLRAKKELGWSPKWDIKKGLEQTVKQFEYHDFKSM